MIEYKIIKEIEQNPLHTQRSLARHLGVSLGKINYVLTELTQKGLISAKCHKKNPGGGRWQYILTPKGLREKIAMTRHYLERRLHEYNQISAEIKDLKKEIAAKTRHD